MTDSPSFTDIEIASTGQRAARELSESEDVIAALLNAKIKSWMASDDPVERERLHAEVRGMDEFRAELRARVAQGCAAKGRLEAES